MGYRSLAETSSKLLKWFADSPQQDCTTIAAIAALRVLGFSYLNLAGDPDASDRLLNTLRALISCICASRARDELILDACDTAAKRGSMKTAPSDAALYAARSAVETNPSRFQFAAQAAVNTAGNALQNGKHELIEAAFRDTRKRPISHAFEQRILLPEKVQEELDNFSLSRENLFNNAAFSSFWARWYERAMAGDPLPWDLQRDVALIPDEIWEQGPEAVAERIAEIEARFEVKQALEKLRNLRTTHSTTSRHGIGGNNPPEPIPEEPELHQTVASTLAAVAEIAEETEQDHPNKEHILAALSVLKSALGKMTGWMGRKADLAVDTAIKTGVPILMAKAAWTADLHSLIGAVEKWLPFLH